MDCIDGMDCFLVTSGSKLFRGSVKAPIGT